MSVRDRSYPYRGSVFRIEFTQILPYKHVLINQPITVTTIITPRLVTVDSEPLNKPAKQAEYQ